MTVTGARLIEPVKTFGRPYQATPDDDEFECEYDPEDAPEPGEVVAEGSAANAGQHLEADAEGLSIIVSLPGRVLLLASSQGDSSFHFYEIGRTPVASRRVLRRGRGRDRRRALRAGADGQADPFGLLVVQNGDAPEPPDTSDVNGYEFDGATQFKYVNFADTLRRSSSERRAAYRDINGLPPAWNPPASDTSCRRRLGQACIAS